MKNIFISNKTIFLVATFALITMVSCKKKDYIVDAIYPDQTIGISQAAVATVGPGANGVYRVTPSVVGSDFKYKVNTTTGKVNISMAVLRSGINLDGAVVADLVVAGADTINKLKATGLIMPTATQVLPSSEFTIPSSVTIENGKAAGEFNLEVNLSFLAANLTDKYAIAIRLASSKLGLVNPGLAVAIVYIDPTVMLLPTAIFGVAVDVPSKMVEFLNRSTNGVTYSWNYGDGTPVETTPFPKHKYTASGTYSTTLTVTGFTGVTSERISNVVIP